MRIVKVEGRDWRELQSLLLQVMRDERLELGIDSEGLKIRYRGSWTLGYGELQPAKRGYTIENDPEDEPPTVDELISRAEIVYRLGEDTDG